MYYLSKEHIVYKMSGQNAPAIRVKEGDTITLQTYDCFKNRLLSPGNHLDSQIFQELNPATGPVFIEGAMPGDTLKVDILKIKLDFMGITEVDSKFGSLAPFIEGMHVKRLPVSKGKLRFNSSLSLDLKPMIGVIGVAPESGEVLTDTPGTHGGNMDCTQIKEGSCVYFPVYREGAMLSVGDLHACMGDGEVGGCGAEISGEVTLRLSVIHQKQRTYPMVVTEDSVIILASKPTVDEACQEAARLFYHFLGEETGLSQHEAVMLLSLAGNLAVCQTVNPLKTVRMSMERKYLEALGVIWE